MRYCWINHKQTSRREFVGHYIWSPKRRRDGSRNRIYDFLREVTPSNLAFSYAAAAVQGAGFAVFYCYTRPRPAGFAIGFGVLVWAGIILREPRLCRWMLRRP